MKNKVQIAVLNDFDGFKANVIEVIERVVLTTGRGSKEKKSVSYKGKRVSVFGLPLSAYDVPVASCISVNKGQF